jgi:hypothetical protein
MFTLKFRKSRSKNYPLVERLAENFYEHSFENDTHCIHLSIKELFEKWDYFNLIFWKSVDWVGSTFGYDGFDLHGHEDKTRIFYSLQTAHVKWICLSESYLSQIAPAYFDEKLIERIKDEVFNTEDTDRILDFILAETNRKGYEKEYGHLKFRAPLRNSDFIGRRLLREEKKLLEKKNEDGSE